MACKLCGKEYGSFVNGYCYAPLIGEDIRCIDIVEFIKNNPEKTRELLNDNEQTNK